MSDKDKSAAEIVEDLVDELNEDDDSPDEEESDADACARLVGSVRENASGVRAYAESDDDDHDLLVYILDKDGEESAEYLSPHEFENDYPEHVIQVGEIWRARRVDNAAFVGVDVLVKSVDLRHVTLRNWHVPLAADNEKARKVLPPESATLALVLDKYEYVCELDEYDVYDGYEPTDADRVKFEKVKKEAREALKVRGAPPPELQEQFIALGMFTREEIDAARGGGLVDIIEKLIDALPGGSKSNNAKKADDLVLAGLGGKPGEPPHVQKDVEIKWGSLGPDDLAVTETTRGDDDMSNEQQVKKLKKEDFKDVRVINEGSQIVLPVGMTKRVGAEWLVIMDKEDERVVSLNHEIACYPIEGAYALYRALKQKYGFVSLRDTPTFFGPEPPAMIGFDISLTEHVQAPWGRIAIPGIDGYLETGAELKPSGEMRFVLNGQVKRRDEQEANDLVELVREFATRRSIYRGKAIRVKFPRDKKDFDFQYVPDFIDTSKVNPAELVFPRDVRELVDVTLFSPIEKTQLCRLTKVPLKRGILLEGPYGVGKTLTAYVTAKKCEDNGWTFMYLDKTADLKQAIMLARNYQPCVIFAEDIDRAMEGKARDQEMDSILNTIDGIDSKSSEIIVVLTTNHVDQINRAMLRPGRLDAVIPVRAPDAAAAAVLVRNYARGLLKATDEELVPVGRALDGLIPAVIREVVERAKLAAIVRLDSGATTLDLVPEDLLKASASMQAQLGLMSQPIPDTREPIEKAADTLASAIRLANGIEDQVQGKANGVPHERPVGGVEA